MPAVASSNSSSVVSPSVMLVHLYVIRVAKLMAFKVLFPCTVICKRFKYIEKALEFFLLSEQKHIYDISSYLS